VRRVPVSVVVPAFNEARRLPTSLPTLLDALRAYPGAEVIVVDDGSVDNTATIAEQLLRDLPTGRVIRLPWNCGKGAAVRVGVAAATGETILFTDADLASDLADLPRLLAALSDAEVAVGSRRVGPGVSRDHVRRIGSWAFNQLTRSFTAIELADTQCGFKAFRHAEAKLLFGMSRAVGFGFDVEVLAMAQAMGYRIVEVPVRWSEEPGGTFRVVRHTPSMLVELARSRRRLRRVTGSLPPPTVRTPNAPTGVTAPAARRPDEGLVAAELPPAGLGHPQPTPMGARLSQPAVDGETPTRPTAL
jgi:dolichyl-phosphate beta-glucosyltransferase